jgi:high-affinity iron transporter
MVPTIETLANTAAPLLITFREALEAALIIGIFGAYLKKIDREDLNRYLFLGVFFAVIVSIVIGGLTAYIFGGLSGTSEELFEGTAAILATIVLTYMIFWMTRNASSIRGELEERVHNTVSRGYVFGIFMLAFLSVAREGLETVLFLTSYAVQDLTATFLGLVIGVTVVVGLSLILMKGASRLNIRKFFKYTSIVLIVFAAGLLGFGVHELIEVGEGSGIDIGPLATKAFDINPPDEANIFHEKGIVGSILKALVGYDGNPEWLRVIVYFSYWIIIGIYMIKAYKQ